jgi:hypothetical protein
LRQNRKPGANICGRSRLPRVNLVQLAKYFRAFLYKGVSLIWIFLRRDLAQAEIKVQFLQRAEHPIPLGQEHGYVVLFVGLGTARPPDEGGIQIEPDEGEDSEDKEECSDVHRAPLFGQSIDDTLDL